jgi:hypothetical protein
VPWLHKRWVYDKILSPRDSTSICSILQIVPGSILVTLVSGGRRPESTGFGKSSLSPLYCDERRFGKSSLSPLYCDERRLHSERMSIKYNPVCNPVGHGSQAVYVHVKDQASTSSSSKMC